MTEATDLTAAATLDGTEILVVGQPLAPYKVTSLRLVKEVLALAGQTWAVAGTFSYTAGAAAEFWRSDGTRSSKLGHDNNGPYWQSSTAGEDFIVHMLTTGSFYVKRTIDSTSTPVVRFDTSSGEVYFPRVSTTASAANAVINNGSTPVNQLLRSTSSGIYKTDIEDIDPDIALKVWRLIRPVWYRSLATADRKDWSWFGIIAEELAEIEPRLVQWAYPVVGEREVEVEIDGKPATVMEPVYGADLVPDGVQYERVSVVALAGARIEQERLEARVAALEAKLA